MKTIKKIRILGRGTKQATLTRTEKGLYTFETVYGDKILCCKIEQTAKGVWLKYNLPPQWKDEKVFLSNKIIDIDY